MTANLQDELNHIIDRKNQANLIENMIQGYRLCARTEGKSEKTIRTYITALNIFTRFLTISEYPHDVTQLGTFEIREFIRYLQNSRTFEHHPYTKPQEKALSGHAINCYMRAIRAFWSWLMREEFINSNPFAKIMIPKPPKKVIATFSEKQIHSLLKVINTASPAGFRDWTMILMLLDTGIRASELSGLTTIDVKLEEGFIKVCGKGNKERIVPIGARVQKALWKYMQRYRPPCYNHLCPTLFLTSSGKAISVNRLESIIEKYAPRAGIEGVRCSPHTFRHTFAISYLRNGGDVFSLQRILGHSSLEIVRMYVNLADADVRAYHRKFSPADNMDIR